MCYLNCEHCREKLLETMLPALNPNDLFRICLKNKRKGGTGCLISGGCLKDGKVPLMKYISVIKQIKEKLKLKVVVHTGLVTHSIAEALASANVDGVMLDIIGANETIKRIYHLNHKVEDFENALAILEQHNIPTIPHIVVGLHFGRIKGQKSFRNHSEILDICISYSYINAFKRHSNGKCKTTSSNGRYRNHYYCKIF